MLTNIFYVIELYITNVIEQMLYNECCEKIKLRNEVIECHQKQNLQEKKL